MLETYAHPKPYPVRDRSGAIEGGHELFGSATRLRGGECHMTGRELERASGLSL